MTQIQRSPQFDFDTTLRKDSPPLAGGTKYMSNSKITLEDLLASQSSVLNRIARDLEEMNGHPSAGHNSSTSGHNSAGTHNSHTSGVSSAPPLKPKKSNDESR
jgi:hypothetical protein